MIYDDDSKLQYAPFIYATTGSGDSGDDGGDDEEGEDSMVVTITVDSTRNIAIGDKTFAEIQAAMTSGKSVIFVWGTLVASVINLLTDEHTLSIIAPGDVGTMTFNLDETTGCPYKSIGDVGGGVG